MHLSASIFKFRAPVITLLSVFVFAEHRAPSGRLVEAEASCLSRVSRATVAPTARMSPSRIPPRIPISRCCPALLQRSPRRRRTNKRGLLQRAHEIDERLPTPTPCPPARPLALCRLLRLINLAVCALAAPRRSPGAHWRASTIFAHNEDDD